MKDVKRAHLIGRHIVTDPKICHGKPTFRGTRVLVADVLEQEAEVVGGEAPVFIPAEIKPKDAKTSIDAVTRTTEGSSIASAASALRKLREKL